MFITIDSTDRALAQKAIELTEKKIESVSANLAELSLPTMEAGRLAGLVYAVKKYVNNTERDGFDFTGDQCLALGVCLDVYHGKLEGLRDSQIKLIVPIDDTSEKLSQLEFLQDKMRGQTRMPLASSGIESVTIATPGRAPVTMTGKQFDRAVEALI